MKQSLSQVKKDIKSGKVSVKKIGNAFVKGNINEMINNMQNTQKTKGNRFNKKKNRMR